MTRKDYDDPRCPDCGKPIEKNPRSAEGIWNHVGDQGDCWRMSYDGPSGEEEQTSNRYLYDVDPGPPHEPSRAILCIASRPLTRHEAAIHAIETTAECDPDLDLSAICNVRLDYSSSEEGQS